MGTLKKTTESLPLKCSGKAQDWLKFKQQVQTEFSKSDDSQAWILESGQLVASVFTNAVKSMLKSAAEASGGVSTKIQDYQTKDVKAIFKPSSISVSIMLDLNKNRKDMMGTNWADHTKQHFEDEDMLAQAHKILDRKHFARENMRLVRLLDDTVFSDGQDETVSTTKLRSILKGQSVTKILAGESSADEPDWIKAPWKMPAVQMWGRRLFYSAKLNR